MKKATILLLLLSIYSCTKEVIIQPEPVETTPCYTCNGSKPLNYLMDHLVCDDDIQAYKMSLYDKGYTVVNCTQVFN